MAVSFNDWKISFNSGGKILESGQVITPDGKFSLVLFKTQIRVYSLSTRQGVRSLRIERDLSDVIATVFSKKNNSIAYLFTKSSKVLAINWKDRVSNPIVEEYNLNIDPSSQGSLVTFLKMNEDEDEFYFITGKQSAQRAPHTRYLLKLSKLQDPIDLTSVKNVLLLNTSINKNHIILLTNKNELVHLRFINNGDEVCTDIISFPFKTQISSLAISSGDDTVVALGTVSGIIQIIYVSDQEKPQRLLKWHIDQVKALSFNHDDTYLLSGGLEKVLSFWHLETDKQQFLPRLSGPLSKIILDEENEDLYGILTQLNDDGDFEYIVISAVDLISRLNVNGVRARFASSLEHIGKDKKRLAKQQVNINEESITKIKHDFTTDFKIHETSKLVYFPYGSYLQAFDIAKNEQSFVTTIAPTIQAGKVKSETLIQDPTLKLFSFSSDDKWMCTFDSLPTPELDNLMSEKDIKYSLKFWMYVDNANGRNVEQGHWELSTKIIDPHGSSVPVVSVIQAPSSYNEGHAFLTIDNKGGIRLWKPKVPKELFANAGINSKQQTAWTLRKIRRGSGKSETDSICVAWSQDSSVLALGQETSVTLIDTNSFEDLEDITLPSLAGSRIRSLEIVDNILIVMAKNRLVTFDLLTFQPTELAFKVNTPIGGKNLLSVDNDRNFFCFCANYYTKSYDLRSRIFVFTPDKLKPIYIADHSAAISTVRYSSSHSAFILLDCDSNIGFLTSSAGNKFALEESEESKALEINTLLSNAKQMAGIRNRYDHKDEDNMDVDIDDELSHRLLSATIFEPVLENLEGLPLDALFDRVMRII